MPFITAQLIPSNQQLVTVTEDDSVQDAISLMTEHDFSQLPVTEHGKLKGIITSDSILRAVSCFGVAPAELKVSHVTHLIKPCRDDDDLSDVLKGLQDSNAIPIVDKQGHVKAIVTSYDSAEYFRRRAEDLMLAEDIESTLRDFIESVYRDSNSNLDQESLRLAIKGIMPSGEELHKKFRKAVCLYLNEANDISTKPDMALIKKLFEEVLAPSNPIKEFDRLTLSEFINLFKSQWAEHHQSVFKDISWSATFKLLDEVRKTRNAIAHFREVTPEQRENLKFCINFLDRHRIEVEAIDPEDLNSHIKNAALVHDELTNIDHDSAILGSVTSIISSTSNNSDISGVEILNQIKNLIAKSEKLPGNLFDIVVPEGSIVSSSILDDFSDASSYQTTAEFGLADEEIDPNESRYAPLAIWLDGQDKNQVSLAFEDIEKIIQDELPPSARNHRHWWANDSVSHTQAQQWLDAGWSVSNVNMNREQVTFSRIGSRQQAYIDFFSALCSRFDQLEGISVGITTQPQGRNYIAVELQSDFLPKMFVVISFARRSRLRLEHYIGNSSRSFNKQVFDILHCQQSEIEQDLGCSLSWERPYGKIGCRIALYRDNSSIEDAAEALGQMQDWLMSMIPQFYAAMSERLLAAYTEVSNQVVAQ